MAEAATASVGESTAPSTKATAQGMPGIRAWTVKPTASTVTKTKAMASWPMARLLRRKSRQDMS